MSDAKVIKEFLKKAPGLLDNLKKPMADLHYTLRELQTVTDDYEDIHADIATFLVHAENAVGSFLKANRLWDDARDELEKMSTAKTVKGKSVAKAPEAFGDAGHGEEDFVKRVKEIVASIPKSDPEKGGWSTHKVFIAHVREKMKMDAKTFDKKLIEANRLGMVSLTRLDLPTAVNPESLRKKVEQGGIVDGRSEFHFIGR
jgi:phage-related protein